jgi:hypothetical protein
LSHNQCPSLMWRSAARAETTGLMPCGLGGAADSSYPQKNVFVDLLPGGKLMSSGRWPDGDQVKVVGYRATFSA